jgi:hypothetical protein
MKKMIGGLVLAASALTTLSGCGFITSHEPSSTAVTGEAWYVKVHWFIIPYSTEIYYCDGKSNVCKAADIQ